MTNEMSALFALHMSMVGTACWKRRGMLSTYWSLKPGHRIRMLMVKCGVLDSQ
jgi:hypothetical protein